MRRLMVKLVALETALVGWLGYWLFLVYSNNPLVSGGLASQLSKFPQLSFTTVDITVLVLISALSILLAFKFDRGLKPGIRLERALQMLESLMKRNLLLEAQIAEMKLASAQNTMSEPPSTSEPPPGSWERAFRTPIEAGPTGLQDTPRTARSAVSEFASNIEPPTQRSWPTRIDSKQTRVMMTPPKQFSARIFSEETSNPEDESTTETRQTPGPEQIREWANPTETTSKSRPAPSAGTMRKTSVVIAQPGSRRQPYIPMHPAKAIVPSTHPGPSVPPLSRTKSEARLASNSPSGSSKSEESNSSIQVSSYQPSESQSSLGSSDSEVTRSALPESYFGDLGEMTKEDVTQSTQRTTGRSSASQKKRFPWEDE